MLVRQRESPIEPWQGSSTARSATRTAPVPHAEGNGTDMADDIAAIRLATDADASVLAVLLYDFNVEFATPTPGAAEFEARFRALLARPGLVAFLAECPDGASCGFALLSLRPTPYFDGPLVQLEELYVVPPLRARGVGGALLAAALAFAESQGSREMHIGVDEADTDARRFYERHGFVNIEPGRDDRMLLYLREH